MRIRNFVLSLMAAAAMFTACENEEAPLGAPSLSFEQESLTVGKEGGTATLSFTATRDWTVSCDESWVSFKSIEGKASVEPQQLTVTADPNDSYDREAEITFVVGKKLVTKTIILYQTGSGQAPLSGEFYSVDFKKDGISGWEVIDVVKPDDLEAVWTESTSYGMVAKAYANNTNYESQSWLVSPSIDLSQVQAAHLCFSHAGKYFSDIKKDVTLWVLQEESKAAEDVEAFTTQLSIPVYPVDFTFVESGDIDLSSYAGSSIRLAFKYKSSTSKAGTYEVQNLRISTEAYDSGEGGGDEGGEGGEEGGEDADAIYFNNFDKEEATKTYGSGNSYPYLDQFEGWKNEQGSGASGVSYLFNGMSARSNSTSDGSYSKYAGSGMNNLFFGKDAYIQVKGIELGESRSLVISFGAEKYLKDGDSNFNKDEFKVYVSDTGKKWVALEYEIGGTEISGTWNLNTSEAFTMPSSKLYIHISASVASAYRLDDLKVVASTEAGKTIDTSNGVDLGTGSGEEGGETGGEEGGDVTLVGAGTLESPYTAADAIALTSKMTANDSMADVYVKGIISSDLEVSLQYGNATFNISDDGSATGEFNIFRALYLGNVKFTSEDQIKIGDEVVLVGTLVNYKGTAPELKDCYIVQLNGVDEGGETGGEEGGEAIISEVSIVDFLAAETGDGKNYRLRGKIESIVNDTYGNFYLQDGTGRVYVYGLTSTLQSGNDRSFSSLGLRAGDIVTIVGQRGRFENAKVEDQKDQVSGAYWESDCKSTDVTLTEFLSKEVASKVFESPYYRLTGVVSEIVNDTYGNFYLKEDAGDTYVYVYGLTQAPVANNDRSFANLGIKAGDIVTIAGQRGRFENAKVEDQKDQVANAYIISVTSVGGGDEGGNTGGEEGGNTGGEEGGNTGGEVDASDYTTTVEYSTISTFDDKGVATINGVSDVKVLKVGSSDAIGSFTLTLPAGTRSVSYYAVGWKGKTTTLKFLQGETEIGIQALVANDGATSISPFTLTVTDADKYSLDFDAALEADTKITVTTTAKARALLFGIQAVK